MSTVDDTVSRIVEAASWDQRVAQIRLVPTRHGTAEHQAIYAAVARAAYVSHLAPDFAYINRSDFYETGYFTEIYALVDDFTEGFEKVAPVELAALIAHDPRSLLVLRTITGLTKEEFARSTVLAGESLGIAGLAGSKVDSMEKRGTAVTGEQATVVAATLTKIVNGTLFGEPSGNLKSKQDKPDTDYGWDTVREMAGNGVPYAVFLHQRHYGGSFRQVLDATSTLRGNLIEDAVEALFQANRIPFIRTGSHNQAEISERFEIAVVPAPDFVVFDESDALRAFLECKGANDGGTARDKALRFERLRQESLRLGGVPLIGILGGIGWSRVNDTLGPVIRDTDGRVFTLANLPDMLTVAPFPALAGVAPRGE